MINTDKLSQTKRSELATQIVSAMVTETRKIHPVSDYEYGVYLHNTELVMAREKSSLSAIQLAYSAARYALGQVSASIPFLIMTTEAKESIEQAGVDSITWDVSK